ncbi:MAG TPA: hypothetical protein VEU51_17200, partial [Candidatus Acidoferrales bacterium]|nr:hypothetical protein [Candidatus Acidoferrales bacterium]
MGEISQRARAGPWRRRTPWWTAALTVTALVASPCLASQPPQIDSTPLIKLAASKFANLTRAERAMLQFADAGSIQRGEIAIAGANADPTDPSNDPRQADKWAHERDIRAALIMWLCDDPAATPLINRAG